MIVKPKCPYCGKKIIFKCNSDNRRNAKKEKKELQIILNLTEKCEFIHH